MRRVVRLAFTICSAASLVLCLASATWWVRSQWRYDLLVYHGTRWHWGFRSHPDRFYLEVAVDDEDSERVPRWTAVSEERWDADNVAADPSMSGRLGFMFGRNTNWSLYDNYVVGLPYWSVTILAAVPPATWAVGRLRRRRRGRTGLCPTCGYDLRATPDRCPECGASRRA